MTKYLNYEVKLQILYAEVVMIIFFFYNFCWDIVNYAFTTHRLANSYFTSSKYNISSIK